MRQIAPSWIFKFTIAKSKVIQKIKRPTMVLPRKTSLLFTWAVCWYLLATVILMIVHAHF